MTDDWHLLLVTLVEDYAPLPHADLTGLNSDDTLEVLLDEGTAVRRRVALLHAFYTELADHVPDLAPSVFQAQDRLTELAGPLRPTATGLINAAAWLHDHVTWGPDGFSIVDDPSTL